MPELPPNLTDLLQNWEQLGGVGSSVVADQALNDTAEKVEVSSLSLLKMVKHGRAGIPMEVMGLMLGEFIDDYSVKVIDVFSMPQSGNSVSVEAVDPVYQAEMLEQLKRTGRHETVVGWYHSHPGFGCWLSGTDISTQQSFEQLNSRAVGVVVDPIQSVRGKVVMDCFRLINPQFLMLGQEPRQTTSYVGHLTKPSLTALVHGLNRNYYSLVMKTKHTPAEKTILSKFYSSTWLKRMKVEKIPSSQLKETESNLQALVELTKKYNESIQNEIASGDSPEVFAVRNAGKVNIRKKLEEQSRIIQESSWVAVMHKLLLLALLKR